MRNYELKRNYDHKNDDLTRLECVVISSNAGPSMKITFIRYSKIDNCTDYRVYHAISDQKVTRLIRRLKRLGFIQDVGVANGVVMVEFWQPD